MVRGRERSASACCNPVFACNFRGTPEVYEAVFIQRQLTALSSVSGSVLGWTLRMDCRRWLFKKRQLAETPSGRRGFSYDVELSRRQQAATFIQKMGQRLCVFPFRASYEQCRIKSPLSASNRLLIFCCATIFLFPKCAS